MAVSSENLRRVLVTGASGFVGTHLCPLLTERGWRVVAAARKQPGGPEILGTERVVLSLSMDPARWQSALLSVTCVIHLAARVHQLDGSCAEEFHRVNVEGTRFVAEQAAHAGVRRFIFLSSIKVNGDSSEAAFRADDVPNPSDPYGRSKRDAEIELRRLCSDAGMELVIVRAPLVYGPGVGANFNRLLQLIESGLPLPFGSLKNRRSLVSVWNLSDFIEKCISAPEAAGETFLVSDGKDLSTPDLVRGLSASLDRPDKLFRFPIGILRFLGKLGFRGEIERLCSSLYLDATAARDKLKWHPRISVEEGLSRTAAAYRAQRRR
jgi:nucleoside-diphosphate-sugar epimerase